jgi:hypothetical protein
MARFCKFDGLAGLFRPLFAAVWVAPILAGCVIYDEALLPSLTGEFATGIRAAPGPGSSPLGMAQLAPNSAPIYLPVAGDGITSGPLQPLAVIRFVKPDLQFEDELRSAIQRALSSKPDAGFGLVAVSPSGQGATLDAVAVQRNIERVLAAMTKAGVAENRVIFSAASDNEATADEVHVYLLDLSKTP